MKNLAFGFSGEEEILDVKVYCSFSVIVCVYAPFGRKLRPWSERNYEFRQRTQSIPYIVGWKSWNLVEPVEVLEDYHRSIDVDATVLMDQSDPRQIAFNCRIYFDCCILDGMVDPLKSALVKILPDVVVGYKRGIDTWKMGFFDDMGDHELIS